VLRIMLLVKPSKPSAQLFQSHASKFTISQLMSSFMKKEDIHKSKVDKDTVTGIEILFPFLLQLL